MSGKMLVISHKGDREGARLAREAWRRGEEQAIGGRLVTKGWRMAAPDTPALAVSAPTSYAHTATVWEVTP